MLGHCERRVYDTPVGRYAALHYAGVLTLRVPERSRARRKDDVLVGKLTLKTASALAEAARSKAEVPATETTFWAFMLCRKRRW